MTQNYAGLLIAAGIMFFIGIFLVILSARLGLWVYNIYLEIRRGFSESLGRKGWWFTTIGLGLWLGPYYFIWIFRIIGFGASAMSVFAYYLVLFY